MRLMRANHAFIAGLSLAAYASGAWGLVHAWLGYGAAGALAVRLLLGLIGPRPLALLRLLVPGAGVPAGAPRARVLPGRVLVSVIVALLLSVCTTGIALDRGQSIGLAGAGLVAAVHASADGDDRDHPGADEHARQNFGAPHWVEEAHEVSAHLLMLAVGLHVGLLLLMRRPMVWFMLFRRSAPAPEPRHPASGADPAG